MPTLLYQLDAFTDQRYRGNPAAVTVLDAYPDDAALQAMAAENNLPETAFLVRQGEDYALRWFTPCVEVPLCGHATLASAAVVMERLEPRRREVTFHSASGPLTVRREAAQPDVSADPSTRYTLNFPVRRCKPAALPAGLAEALGAHPVEVAHDGFNYVARMADEQTVRRLAPDLDAIARLCDVAGVIVTAQGDGLYDIVSRYFAPVKGIPEDPVTGGAHCALAHFWSERLGRTELRAWQASPRGGEIRLRLLGDRVELEGSCVFYMQGELC
jgi:PhzF family phenazine biosynthesis protein